MTDKIFPVTGPPLKTTAPPSGGARTASVPQVYREKNRIMIDGAFV